MNKFKIIIVTILILTMTLLSGCWSYKELDKSTLVAGIAIDYDNVSQEYIVTTEIINLTSDKMEGELFQSRGKSVFSAIRNCTSQNGRKLLVAHVEILIISKEIAKAKMLPVIDYLFRDAEYPDDMYILLSNEKTAAEVLELTKMEEDAKEHLYDITSFFINDSLRNQNVISKYCGVNLWQYILQLFQEGASAYLPIIKIVELNNINFPEIYGTAIFKNNKYVGALNQQETIYHLIIIDKLEGGILLVDFNDKSKISLEVFNSKSKLKPILKNGELTMKLDITINVGIGEISSSVNVLDKKKRPLLKKQAEMQIKERITNTIKKVQNDYNADIFLFSTKIKSHMPNEWKSISTNWENVFSKLPVEVNVKVNINSSSLTNKTISPSP